MLGTNILLVSKAVEKTIRDSSVDTLLSLRHLGLQLTLVSLSSTRRTVISGRSLHRPWPRKACKIMILF